MTVRDLEINKHSIDKNAIVVISFENKNKASHIVKAVIIREIHLIKNLRANLFIENNILKLKLIDVFTSINIVSIENYDVTISITINIKTKFQHMSVDELKTIIVLFQFECLVKVYNIILPNKNDLSKSIFLVGCFIYGYLVNSSTNVILVRNNIKNVIKISSNF